jgi:hypothetical protein
VFHSKRVSFRVAGFVTGPASAAFFVSDSVSLPSILNVFTAKVPGFMIAGFLAVSGSKDRKPTAVCRSKRRTASKLWDMKYTAPSGYDFAIPDERLDEAASRRRRTLMARP